jgi:hypothetical protein
VSHRHPLDVAFFERASDQIERVAHDAIAMLDASILQGSTMISATSLPIAFNPAVTVPVTTCTQLQAWGLYPNART